MSEIKNEIDNIIKNNDEKSAFYKLCEMFDMGENSPYLTEKIKELFLPYKNGAMGLAQINPIAGNLEYNAKKIVKYIRHAQNIGLKTVIFPELCLMGYPIEDVIDRHPFLVQQNVAWLIEIAKIVKDEVVLIGFVEPRNYLDAGKKYYNSVAILTNGKIEKIVRKTLLPTYSEFNDYRYIEPSPVVGVQKGSTLGHFSIKEVENCKKTFEFDNKKLAITICEDCWNNREFFNDNVLYKIDPIEELADEQPDIFINCSASPTRAKKEQLKHNMLSFVSKKYKTPFVYVNQTGAIDNISFEGASRVFDENGKLFARAKSFEEQFLIVNIGKNLGKIYPLTKGLEKSLTETKIYTLEYEPDLERTYKTIIQGIRDYFNKTGFKRAVLGLSGGLDSTVCAVLLADALGANNVFGISMPSKITSAESKSDAKLLADNLNINFLELPIKDIVETTKGALGTLFKGVEKKWQGRFSQSFTMDNIQARSRAIYLWGIANEFSSTLPIATSDKSELYMGYATINGDMSGGFAPIADVCKTKLFALARWLNENRAVKNAIPEAIILKKPGAELAIDPKTGKPLIAEDALMPYEFLDEVIWRIENKKECYFDMLNSEFLYEKKNKVSKEEKTAWLDKFYRRMSTALYKWSILPPSIIVDSRSINKFDYRQPITSSKINYKGLNSKEIQEKIAEF